VAQQPNSSPGHLKVEFPRSHTHTDRQTDRQTHTHTPVGLLWTNDQLVAEAATYATHNKHKRRTSVHSVGFEPAIPAIKWQQTYALRRHGHRDRPKNCYTTAHFKTSAISYSKDLIHGRVLKIRKLAYGDRIVHRSQAKNKINTAAGPDR
jgi:hypothetical protein